MVRLPQAEDAVIAADKLRGYLLSPDHPVGGFKAVYFGRLGYSADNWQLLETDFRSLVRACDVAMTQQTRHGEKFVVEGWLTGPSGQTVRIVTVWIILKGESVPRFVTAYPGERR